MPDESLEGWFGGGNIDTLMSGGEVYLNAKQTVDLFYMCAAHMVEWTMATGDNEGGTVAYLMMCLAEELAALRSELFKREAEKLFQAE